MSKNNKYMLNYDDSSSEEEEENEFNNYSGIKLEFGIQETQKNLEEHSSGIIQGSTLNLKLSFIWLCSEACNFP